MGSVTLLSPPVPSWPQVLLPHTNTLPSSLRAMLKLIPEDTFTMLLISSSTRSLLLFACPLTPLTLRSPITKTLPYELTKVMQSLAQDAQRTFCRLILVGALLLSLRSDSLVPMVLNFSLRCSKPHTYAQPLVVIAHMCWYPQLTCATLSRNSTSRGMRTLRLGGVCPSTPLRFFPQVSSFPSDVIPADSDFLQSMSTKITFLIICGRERFDSDPIPNSPLRPKPQDQACPSLCWEPSSDTGKKTAAPRAKDTIILRFIIVEGNQTSDNQNQLTDQAPKFDDRRMRQNSDNEVRRPTINDDFCSVMRLLEQTNRRLQKYQNFSPQRLRCFSKSRNCLSRSIYLSSFFILQAFSSLSDLTFSNLDILTSPLGLLTLSKTFFLAVRTDSSSISCSLFYGDYCSLEKRSRFTQARLSMNLFSLELEADLPLELLLRQ